MRALLLLLAAGCATDKDDLPAKVDLAGTYLEQSSTNQDPCDGVPLDDTRGFYFVFTAADGGFDVAGFADVAHTTPIFSWPVGVPLRSPIDGGWSGTLAYAGMPNDAPGCYLGYVEATVSRSGDLLMMDAHQYSERADSACTVPEATARATTMPCVVHDVTTATLTN